MGWVPLLAAIWVLLAVGTALLVGAAIRLADRKERRADGESGRNDAESA